MKKSVYNKTAKWLLSLLIAFFVSNTHAQTELMAWGNITGIRIDGQLFDFETSLAVVSKDWKSINATGKELQKPHYTRNGETQTVTTAINNIRFTQAVTDISKGKASVSVEWEADNIFQLEGVFFRIALPEKRYSTREILFDEKKITITGKNQKLEFDFDKKVKDFERKEQGTATMIYIRLADGEIRKGQKSRLHFTITADGKIENDPVEIQVDIHNPGREFLGLGGNFRLQSSTDSMVVDYCLNNMRVAFGRVDMPWMDWQPDENSDPLADALSGKINKHVAESMRIAQRLKALGMPVIITSWFPPRWAADFSKRHEGGVAALRLYPGKQQKIYKSLADYLVCLKKLYGVEAALFSFNESDIGIDVLHTTQEHSLFIKDFGAVMASRGLATKMLLGDNSDATTYDFILPALNDPETYPFIGAVSFHSWRGCNDETLRKWTGASRQLNVPLIVGEGSTDAAAYSYPQVFIEPTFALYEINLYTRICAICQPQSILQWQLTSDYSPLWGNGIYGSTGQLHPTQRFWNLKQLASTPEQAFSLPFTCTREEVNAAVFGNLSRGEYVVHAVNNGAARLATIKGLPVNNASKVKVYVTNSVQGMEEIKDFKIVDGFIQLALPAVSFVSVFVGM